MVGCIVLFCNNFIKKEYIMKIILQFFQNAIEDKYFKKREKKGQ